MATLSDGPLSLRAHYTALAAHYLTEHKRPGEPVGVAVESARPGGWVVAVKIGDVGVRCRLGPEPSDDEIRATLARFEDARKQAQLGADVTARTHRGGR